MSDALEMAKKLAEKAKAKPLFTVSPEFKKHFNAVAAHYRCDAEEVKEMKECVRKDYENAKISFSEMYKEIQ